MTSDNSHKTAAAHLADCLAMQGVDRIFCVPGESYLAVIDALYDHHEQIQLVTCRHEGAAAMMAEADGKLTGRPGICMVTRGPGATNASAGLHVAFQDSTPMILFIGQIARDAMEREAFQEVDYRRMFGQMAKWVAQVDDPSRMTEMVSRAFAVAMAGRPGPVVLALPEDMLVEEVTQPALRRMEPVEIYPAPAQMDAFAEMISRAERPVIVLGGSRWDAAAGRKVEEFAGRTGLPVVASFRRQDIFDNEHPNYIGELGLGANPALRRLVGDSDLIVLMGTRMGDITSDGYQTLSIPSPQQKLIHIHADANELGRVYQADLAVNATPRVFAAALAEVELSPGPWAARTVAARNSYEAWQRPNAAPGTVNMGEIICWMRDTQPPDTIFTNGAGNFSAWLHRFHRHRRYGTQLAPTSGSMGYGVPAAIAAGLRHPARGVVCVAGDGDFMMSMAELATANQYGSAPIFVIVDNGMLGTIRMHQETNYPARPYATDLVNPDFCALAHACGAYAEYVDRTEDFAPAFARAQASGKAAVLHVKVDPEALTANRSLSQIRAAAQGGIRS